jgi:hypothetical protein
MRPLVLAFAFLFFISQNIVAQTPLPDHAWIGTGRVSAKINNKGALVTDFLVPNEDGDGDSLISTVSEISIWMGGLDPAGNLILAIQKPDTALSDFWGGFRNVPNSAGVWKVTKEEIEQHTQDFEEDGDIDVMIPSIFSWPGWSNPYSQQFNGFSLDSIHNYLTAPFADNPFDWNGIYEPHLGEHPFIDYVIYNFDKEPDEIVYTPYHTKETAPSIIKLNGKAVFFVYYCDDATFLEDAIFGYTQFIYTGQERLDSFFLSYYVDGNIGNPGDDYLGSLPYSGTTYFYNADSIDEDGFESNPPIFGFDIHSGILDTFGHYQGVSNVIPIHRFDEGFPPGTTAPQLPQEYYNYITGSWRDGSPLSYGGDGYQENTQTASFIFPGNPGNPAEWSEISANTLPGDRRAVISSGPVTIKPNAGNRSFFSFENVSGDNIAEQVERLRQYSLTQEDFFYTDYFPPDPSPFDTIACLNTTSVNQPTSISGLIFPNPASTHLTLRAEESGLQQVALFDMLGRTVASRQNFPADSQEITLPVAGLPSGIYLLQWTMRDGRRGSGKILVAK